MHDDEASPFLGRLPEETRFATWHLVQRDGRLVSRGEAGVAVLGHMVATRWLARLLSLRLLRLPLEGLYALVSSNRSRLGRLVPDRPGPRRFP